MDNRKTESVRIGNQRLIRSNMASARLRWGALPKALLVGLKTLSIEHRLSVQSGDLSLLDDRWYVTHIGLLRLARRLRCAGISVEAVPELSDAVGKKCLGKQELIDSALVRRPGADLGVFDELTY